MSTRKKAATAAQKKTWRRLVVGRKTQCSSQADVNPWYECTRNVGHAQPHVGHGGARAGFAAWDDAGWYEER